MGDNRLFKFVLILAFGPLATRCLLLQRREPTARNWPRLVDRRAALLPERRLADKTFRVDPGVAANPERLDPKHKRLKLMLMAAKILKRARRNHLTIKRVTVGSRLKRRFNDRAVVKELGEYLNDKGLEKRIRKLKRQIEGSPKPNSDMKGKGKVDGRSTRSNEEERNLGVTDMAKSAAGGLSGNKIPPMTYLPGIGGPFGGTPPMLMGPVKSHPENNITINRTPEPKSKDKLDPIKMQKSSLLYQKDQLDILNRRVGVLGETFTGMDELIDNGKAHLLDKISNLDNR